VAEPELKLVRPAPPRAPRGRRTAVGLGATLLLIGLAATLFGTDLARVRQAPREVGESTLRLALLEGSDHPEVRAKLLDLRGALGRRPLDSMTRAVYSSLLLSLGRDADDIAAAVFHVERAVELAPVTLPVVRIGVLVLAHTNHATEAAALVHSVFDYAPETGAYLLAEIEPLLLGVDVERVVPEQPAPWLAWALRLDRDERYDEALDWLERGTRLWPDDMPLLERAALRALQAGNWERLAGLFPEDREIPLEQPAAGALIHRARLHAHWGERAAALRDIERALALDAENPNIRIGAGAVYLEAGSFEEARHEWNRVLFDLGPSETELQHDLLRRLARLEDDHGSPVAALHAWQALLEMDPESATARDRIAELTGVRPR
jgi:tetratricopeptide (TPR) repeat protein